MAKGDLLLAVIFNPLLFALRGTRNKCSILLSKIMSKVNPGRGDYGTTPQEEVVVPVSAKERGVGKWGSN